MIGVRARLGSGPAHAGTTVGELRRGNGNSRGNLPEKVELPGAQRSDFSDSETLETHGANSDPRQRHHFMAELREHPANLAILAFGENHFEDACLSLLADDPHALGSNLALGEPDTLGELVENLALGKAGDHDSINLLNAKFGVSEFVGEVAVVGQENQTRALLVEPSDCVHPLRDLGEQVDHQGFSGGVVIAGDVTLGLVDGVINMPLKPDLLTVDMNGRVRGVDLDAEFLGNLAVDRHSPLRDEFLASPSRSQARLSEDFLQPLGTVASFGSLRLATGCLGAWLKRRASSRPVGTAGAVLRAVGSRGSAGSGTERTSWRRGIPRTRGRAAICHRSLVSRSKPAHS